MTMSFASPINVSAGASYMFCIGPASFLQYLKTVCSCCPKHVLSRFIARAIAQPQFEHDDLPQLMLVALKSVTKTFEPRRHTGAIDNSSFNHLQLLCSSE